jgi:tRNA U34 5-methylaminomethyl-2-thiouridine-forming methyltransferase MnmC
LKDISNNFIAREHVLTADGSSTLKLSLMNEQFHSMHGAIQESELVYIKNGLDYCTQEDIKILEIGFGTGLNCLLTFTKNESVERPKNIDYTGIEPFPIDKMLLNQLNYKQLINTNSDSDVFKEIHTNINCQQVTISKYFTLNRSTHKIQEFIGNNHHFDVIYFDAFGPSIQPDMWTISIFDQMYKLLKTGGILVTYCAKGEVKRNLKAVGFNIENLPGPPGKREITRAIK